MSDWTPVQIEHRLTQLLSSLTNAQFALAEARDLEVAAEITYRQARDAAAAHAPVPKRGEVTVGERDEWLDAQTREQWAGRLRATCEREKAQEYLRVVRDQAEIVRSIGSSVRTAYSLAGAS